MVPYSPVLYASEEEWGRLSPPARAAVLRMLREHGMLSDGEELHISPLLAPIGGVGGEPCVSDPAVAAALRKAAPDTLEAVSITVFVCMEDVKEVCFVVAYAPPGHAATRDARGRANTPFSGCPTDDPAT